MTGTEMILSNCEEFEVSDALYLKDRVLEAYEALCCYKSSVDQAVYSRAYNALKEYCSMFDKDITDILTDSDLQKIAEQYE